MVGAVLALKGRVRRVSRGEEDSWDGEAGPRWEETLRQGQGDEMQVDAFKDQEGPQCEQERGQGKRVLEGAMGRQRQPG